MPLLVGLAVSVEHGKGQWLYLFGESHSPRHGDENPLHPQYRRRLPEGTQSVGPGPPQPQLIINSGGRFHIGNPETHEFRLELRPGLTSD